MTLGPLVDSSCHDHWYFYVVLTNLRSNSVFVVNTEAPMLSIIKLALYADSFFIHTFFRIQIFHFFILSMIQVRFVENVHASGRRFYFEIIQVSGQSLPLGQKPVFYKTYCTSVELHVIVIMLDQ